MSNHIFSNELIYRLKRPLTWVFALMLLVQGATYSRSTYNLIVNDGVWVNAAGITHINIAGVGFLLFVIVAIITGTVIFKDIEYRMAGIIYTKPINEKQYFLKKFLAAYTINTLLSVAYVIGIVLTPWLGASPNQITGQVLWGQTLQAFILFMLPNLFLLTGISISLVVLFRNMAASYVGLFVVMILFLIAESTRESSVHLDVILLLDPFAYGITREVVDAMSVPDKNAAYFPLTNILIVNRVIWFTIALGLFAFSYRRFSFKRFIMASRKKEKKDSKTLDEPETISAGKLSKPFTALNFSQKTMLAKVFRLSWVEFKGLVRPVNFRIILIVIMALFLCYHLLWSEKYYIETPQLPLTYLMTVARQPLGLYLIIFFTVWSIELLFKDRTVGLWQVKDAMPVPVWVTLLSRFLAMAWVAFVCSVCLLVIGVLVQLGRGFTCIDWSLYLQDLFGIRLGWFNYMMIVALAFVVGAVTNNRFAAHGIAVGIMLFEVVANITGTVEQLRFLYIYVPGLEGYSEMNGYGIFAVSAPWYVLMWAVLAISFLLLSVWLWNRGTGKPLLSRLALSEKRLSLPFKLILGISLSAFFLLQSFIKTNVNTVNEFRTTVQEHAWKADYEKKYKWLEDYPQPKYTAIDLSVNLYPGQRKADYTASIELSNFTETAIDTLYLNVKDFAVIKSIKAGGKALSLIEVDKTHRLLKCAFSKPLQAGQHTKLDIAATLAYRGFTQKDPQPDLVFNGSFLGRDIVPVVGYDTDKELTENRERDKLGLEKLGSRMEPVTDAKALTEIAGLPDAACVKGRITVSTSAEQLPIATGLLQCRWEENGRNFVTYTIPDNTAFDWRVGSANYAIYPFDMTDSIKGQVYYHPAHSWNIGAIVDATVNAVAYLKPVLGQYPYPTLQIAEIPYYNNEFYVSHSLIAIPEKHGWTADLKRKNDEAYIAYIMVREIARQLISQKVKIANVQGAGIFQYALPDYYAIQYVRQKYGEQTYKDLLQRKISDYKKERGAEANEEPALVYTDGAEYVERDKGGVVFCRLQERAGKLDDMLKDFFAQASESGNAVTGKGLVDYLKNHLPAEVQEQVKTNFEEVNPLD
jgi:ABC-2 type transport system permease protein